MVTLSPKMAWDFYKVGLENVAEHMMNYVEDIMKGEYKLNLMDLFEHIRKVDWPNVKLAAEASEEGVKEIVKIESMLKILINAVLFLCKQQPEDFYKLSKLTAVLPLITLVHLRVMEQNPIFFISQMCIDTNICIKATNSDVNWKKIDAYIPFITFPEEPTSEAQCEALQIESEVASHSNAPQVFFPSESPAASTLQRETVYEDAKNDQPSEAQASTESAIFEETPISAADNDGNSTQDVSPTSLSSTMSRILETVAEEKEKLEQENIVEEPYTPTTPRRSKRIKNIVKPKSPEPIVYSTPKRRKSKRASKCTK